jgi:EamA-like transporter family
MPSATVLTRTPLAAYSMASDRVTAFRAQVYTPRQRTRGPGSHPELDQQWRCPLLGPHRLRRHDHPRAVPALLTCEAPGGAVPRNRPARRARTAGALVRDAERTGVALAAGAVLLVGGSVAASGLLAGYPVLGGQAIRYAAAGLLLTGWARLRHQQLPCPAGREWCWLAVLAAVGLAGCSVLLIMATRAASPAGVGVIIGAAPLIITIAGPAAAGRRPPGRVLAASGVVTAGAVISQLVR